MPVSSEVKDEVAETSVEEDDDEEEDEEEEEDDEEDDDVNDADEVLEDESAAQHNTDGTCCFKAPSPRTQPYVGTWTNTAPVSMPMIDAANDDKEDVDE
jgi:hypothetical protein